MLTRSFVFAKGLTEDQERLLWSRGVTTWDTLRKHRGESAAAIGEARATRLVQAVNEADEAWKAGNAQWFKNNWPERELWRLLDGYAKPGEVAYVDIETTGRTPGYDQVTVIGLSDGVKERAFVADRPQDGDEAIGAFLDAIRPFKLLVTFNGISFDVPFLERLFLKEHWRPQVPHVDLFLLAKSVGLHGGLKDMEKALGIARADEVKGIRGSNAIELWGAWKRGDRAAYTTLVTYCKADCTNLKQLGDILHAKKLATAYTPFAKDIDLDRQAGEQLSLFG